MDQLTETRSSPGVDGPTRWQPRPVIRDHGMRRRQVLRNIAVLAFATRLGGCGSAGTGAARTAKSKLDQTVFAEDFGAKGDGVTDNVDALQAALNTGKRVWLQRGLTYAFGSPLVIPNGGGFVGRGLLLMLTGTGKFDRVDYTGTIQGSFGLYLDTVSNVKIEARIKMQTNAGIRTCSAVWVSNCSHVELDVEAFGFKEARFGLVEWNTNVGGNVNLNAHDCRVNSNTLPSMQVTALSVDNNRVGGVNSLGLRFDVRCKDIYFGAAAIAAYGFQTDGVNLQGSGYAGHTGRVVAQNVYEPFDCFSDSNQVQVKARDCYFGVKLAHGASHNIIHATVDRYMKYGAIMIGSSSPVVFKPVSYNRIYLTATNGGVIGTLGNVAAAGTDGIGSTYLPQNNYVEVSYKGDGINQEYGVFEEAGLKNTFVVQGEGHAIAMGKIAPTAGTGKNASTIKNAEARAPGR